LRNRGKVLWIEKPNSRSCMHLRKIFSSLQGIIPREVSGQQLRQQFRPDSNFGPRAARPLRYTPRGHPPTRYTPIRCTPQEMQAYNMHAQKIHSREIHTNEMHAYGIRRLWNTLHAWMHAHEMHTPRCTPVRYIPMGCTPMRCTPIRCIP
jgi:hypothetical protein